MKRTFCAASLCILLLFAAGTVFAQPPALVLLNSQWTGDLTFVHVDGTTSVLTGSTLTITTKSGNFFSGTISDPAIVFSAVKGGHDLYMTAHNFKLAAEIVRGHRAHDGTRTPDVLYIQGSNFIDGSMFVGTLKKQ